MDGFDVAIGDLTRLAKGLGAASDALSSVSTTAATLGLPGDAFGRLSDSAAVAASYAEIQQRLADRTKKGSRVLDGVDRGLRTSAKHYRDTDRLPTATSPT